MYVAGAFFFHTAYRCTVAPFVVERFLTLCPFEYVAEVAVDELAHPRNV